MLNVLIAEDSAIIKATLKNVFQYLSCKVIAVSDGVDAVEKFNSDIDIVIMDYNMPTMKGDETIRLMRQAEKTWPKTKKPAYILASSAISAVEIRQLLLDAGANDVILKPLNMDMLEALVNKLSHFPPTGS